MAITLYKSGFYLLTASSDTILTFCVISDKINIVESRIIEDCVINGSLNNVIISWEALLVPTYCSKGRSFGVLCSHVTSWCIVIFENLVDIFSAGQDDRTPPLDPCFEV
jgi:hypothetical protein